MMEKLMPKQDSLLLAAFQGTNDRVPVWLMRQAGRFLPEYRAIKTEHSLQQMFQTPEIAAEVTCLPVPILGVDAAILFSDILTLPSQMGFDIKFTNESGPVISNPLKSSADFEKVHDFKNLSFVAETIKTANQMLPKHVPLIGFAGAPFTVLSYLVEGGSSVNFAGVFNLMAEKPEQFHGLLKTLTKNTIDYLNLQKEVGIKAFQLFDTWGGILRPADYAHFVLPYLKEIFARVDLPSIYYLKNCSHLLALMEKSGADFLSVCHTVVLGHNSVLAKTEKGIQGNLFNGLLYADEETLKKEVSDILIGARNYKRYIFNLSHGLFPDMEVKKVKFVVDTVHRFDWVNR